MGAVDTLRASWAGSGKKWIIGGAIVGAGYLWWTRSRDTGPSTSGAAQITDGGSAVADPVTPAGGDYSPPAEAPERPSTNGEWLAAAVARLSAEPYNKSSVAVFNALTKALGGEGLTTAEMSIVETAITVLGSPPEGMPKLNLTSPAQGSTPTPNPSTPPPATSTPTSYVVKSGDTLTKIGATWGKTWRQVYDRNAATIEAAAKAHGRASSRGGPNNSPGWYIYPGTRLYKP